MTRDREKFVFDMLDACRFVMEMTAGQDVSRYRRDRVFRGSIERELQILGEAMLQLKSLDASYAARISERDRIIGFRHKLVHGYDAIDPEVVWDIVMTRLPVLRSELETLLAERGPDRAP